MHAPACSHKKPTLRRFFMLLAFVLSARREHAVVAAEPLSEATGTHQLCRSGTHAALARAQRQLGQAEVTSAGLLPNPTLVVQDQRTLSGPSERETVLGVGLPLALNGRRSLLRDAGKARHDEASAQARAKLFEAALSFRAAYLEAWLSQAEAQILEQQQATLDTLADAIQALSKRGEAAGNDLLRQSTQAQIHRARLEAARARALGSSARLATWIDAEIVLPPLDLTELQRPPLPVLSRRDATSPGLQSLEASARASELEARAARRLWLPDPEIFAGYRELAAGAEVSRGLSLSISLPLALFDHGQGEAAIADAQQALALSSAANLRRQTEAEMRAAIVQLEKLSTALAVADHASKNAPVLEAQAQRLYAAGESSINELLETFRQAEEARLTQLELARQLGMTRLSLMHAAGSMFDPALDADCGGGEAR